MAQEPDFLQEPEFTPAQDAAIARSNAAAERGDIEESLDALAEVGLLQSSINEDGNKQYTMQPNIAKIILEVTNEDGSMKEETS